MWKAFEALISYGHDQAKQEAERAQAQRECFLDAMRNLTELQDNTPKKSDVLLQVAFCVLDCKGPGVKQWINQTIMADYKIRITEGSPLVYLASALESSNYHRECMFDLFRLVRNALAHLQMHCSMATRRTVQEYIVDSVPDVLRVWVTFLSRIQELKLASEFGLGEGKAEEYRCCLSNAGCRALEPQTLLHL